MSWILKFLSGGIVDKIMGVFDRYQQRKVDVAQSEIAAEIEERKIQSQIGSDIRSHELENNKLEVDDIKDARQYQQSPRVDKWNAFVDGLNRLITPALTVWALGVLIGWLPLPPELDTNTFFLISGVFIYWTGRRVIQEVKK